MKSMNLKRFASTVMAAVLALALAVPAFASSTNITGTYRAITLNVTVPTTGSAIINPYGLPFDVSGASVSGQQITTGAPLLVQNKSSVPLSVSASIVSTVKGAFVFDDNAITAGETGNKGNVLFQMFKAPGVTEANVTDMEAIAPKFAALKDADALCNTVLTKTDATATPAVPAKEENNIVTLKPANANGELVDGGAAFFRLSGTVAKKPTTAWTTTDGFTAKITFTFEPTIEEVELTDALTAKAADGTSALGTANTIDGTIDTTATIILDTTKLPSGVTVDDWTWESSDTAAATIAEQTPDTKATLTHVAAGTTTVRASGMGSDGKLYSAELEITCAA